MEPQPRDWKKIALKYGGWVLGVFASAIAAYYGIVVPAPAPPEAVPPAAVGSPSP